MIPWKLLSVVFWAAYLLLPGRFFGADGSALLIKPAPLSVGAEQVHVQVTRSKGEMTVYWVSPLNISSIHYGTNKQNLENKIVSMSGVQYTYLGQQAASGFKREYRSNFLHELILVDLAQDTTYYYQVGDWKNLYSRVHSFKTRPGDPDAEISFSTLGDQGPGVNIRGSYAQRVLQQLEKDRINDHFMLHAGDIIYADGNQDAWDGYGKWMEPFAAQVPIMYALGNKEHEPWNGINPYSTWLMRMRHNEWNNDMFWQPFWYSFDYGPVHVVVLSSEHSEFRGRKMWDWLADDLQVADQPSRRKETPFIVAVIHRPIYNSGLTALNETIASKIEPLFEQHRVSIVLNGHCHNYERTKPMFKGKVTNPGRGSDRDPYQSNLFEPKEQGQTHGVVYLTVGTGGMQSDRCPTMPWTVGNTMKVYGYGGFAVTRKSLSFKFVDISGRVRDAFVICSSPKCSPPPPIANKAIDGGTMKDEPEAQESDEENPDGEAFHVLEECDEEADLSANSGSAEIAINALGSGCPTDIVTSVPFKIEFNTWFLKMYPENQNTTLLVLPGQFIGAFINDTAKAAELAPPQIDLYGAVIDGDRVTLSVDVVFPVGSPTENITSFRDSLVKDPTKIYNSFSPGMFTVLRDDPKVVAPPQTQQPLEDEEPVDSPAELLPSLSPLIGQDLPPDLGAVAREVVVVGASHQDTGWWKKIDATMTNVGRSLGIKSATGVYIFWGFILAMAVLLMIVAVLLSCRAFSCCCFRNSYGSSYSSSGRSEAYLLKASMQMPTADTRASISGFSESQAPSRVYEDYHQAVSHMIKPHQHRCAGVISIDVPGSGYDTQYHQNALQSWRTTSEYGGSDRIQAQGAAFRNSMTHTAGPTLSIMDVRGGTTTDAPPMLYEIPHSGHHWETLPTSHYEITRPAHTWDYDRSSAGLNDAQYEIQRHTAAEYYSHGPLATPKSRTVVVRQMHQEPYGNHFRSDSVGQPLTSYASTPREIYDENQGLEDVCGIAPPSMMGAWQVQ